MTHQAAAPAPIEEHPAGRREPGGRNRLISLE